MSILEVCTEISTSNIIEDQHITITDDDKLQIITSDLFYKD